ncbi:x-ray induced transcript 1 [Striga asiatica]|uniref:X-ray induced transcript 1 n=1 Tax=Striga asiatica TaxID=4170 RepID=A0A5A7RAJ7_STRAF|nr:x-ray induced transcript 1 [Striga asiatica]
MSCSNGNDVWDWESHEYYIEDNTTIEIPNSLLNGVSENADDISYTFNNETTPVKACGDLAYHVTSNEVMEKESEQCKEPSSQVKRRRMLQFDSEVLDAPPFNDDAFLRSKETQESLADALSEMSEWAAGFAGTSASIDECLDPSSEGWIADCINDAEMHFCTEEMASDPSEDVQIDITELCNSPPQFDATQVKKNPVRTHQNVIFKGKKSYIRTPPKLASSVVYPFTFIKPCAIHGDMTLKDINQKIHNPPKSKPNEDDPSVSYPTSAFSGKPVVGKTKIRTEGGKGSITIMRTKG